MKRYIIFTILLFVSAFNVKALVCEDDMKVRYQELAKNITYSYEYNDSNNTFNLYFTNIDNELYLENYDTEEEYNYQSTELMIPNVIPGNTYKYDVLTKKVFCAGKSLYMIYVTLPYYNPYHNNELCSGIENYKYCKKFINKNVTYEEFVKNVTDYRNKLASNNVEEKKDNALSVFKKIFDFILKYYYIILPAIVVIIVLIVWLYDKKHDLF